MGELGHSDDRVVEVVVLCDFCFDEVYLCLSGVYFGGDVDCVITICWW